MTSAAQSAVWPNATRSGAQTQECRGGGRIPPRPGAAQTQPNPTWPAKQPGELAPLGFNAGRSEWKSAAGRLRRPIRKETIVKAQNKLKNEGSRRPNNLGAENRETGWTGTRAQTALRACLAAALSLALASCGGIRVPGLTLDVNGDQPSSGPDLAPEATPSPSALGSPDWIPIHEDNAPGVSAAVDAQSLSAPDDGALRYTLNIVSGDVNNISREAMDCKKRLARSLAFWDATRSRWIESRAPWSKIALGERYGDKYRMVVYLTLCENRNGQDLKKAAQKLAH